MHHQGRRISHVRNQQEARSKQGNRKYRSTFNELNGVIAHHTELYIAATAAGISNPTEFRPGFEKKLVHHFVYYIRFEVFAALEMHTVVSGFMTPYSLIGGYQCLERITTIFEIGKREYAPDWYVGK
jgi:hypothetical protein